MSRMGSTVIGNAKGRARLRAFRKSVGLLKYVWGMYFLNS
jgi:hypothetical protein